MENIFTKILDASPGLAVAILMVIIFMRYIQSKDALFQTLFDRVEGLHTKTIDSLMQITEKCTKNNIKG
jgi:hypothetical protein